MMEPAPTIPGSARWSTRTGAFGRAKGSGKPSSQRFPRICRPAGSPLRAESSKTREGEGVSSPPILRRRTRQRAKWEIPVKMIEAEASRMNHEEMQCADYWVF